VVYTSGSLDVAIRELAHTDPDALSSNTASYEIEIPDTVPVAFLDLTALPHDWCEIDDHPGCRAVGDRWLSDGAYPVLAVPSAVVNGAWNYLVNPVHAEARQVRVVTSAPVQLDRRLLD
jgi:RES domain-containing protein